MYNITKKYLMGFISQIEIKQIRRNIYVMQKIHVWTKYFLILYGCYVKIV